MQTQTVLRRQGLYTAGPTVLLFFLTACSLSIAGDEPASLAVAVVFPGTDASSHQTHHSSDIDPENSVGALALEQVDFRLILADEAELYRSPETCARLASDFQTESPITGGNADYLASTFSVQPGATTSTRLEGLHPDTRYLIVVSALPHDDATGPGDRLYGYTRVNTRAGLTTNAVVHLGPSATEMAAHLAEWYGIELVVAVEGLNVTIELVGFDLVVNLGGQEAVLDRLLNETMTVTVTPPAGVEFTSYEWLLNGGPNYPNATPFNTGTNSVTVGSDPVFGLPLGTHTVSLVVTDSGGTPYSTAFSFTLVEGF